MGDDLWQLDAIGLAKMTRGGIVSCREVVKSTLDRLHTVNPVVNAITMALDDSALAAADAADKTMRSGVATGPLHGVPVTIKINTDQIGCPTDDGLINFAKVLPKEDSPLVARLRAAGAIPIGRTNSPAFGLAQNAENLLHGKTLNPWDHRIMCGGSSGGAAVAVATGMGPIGQGNDLAGSIRWPAFANGVVGLRPSPGIIPYYNSTYRGGMIFCEQLMTVHGPIARSVRDARLALSVMAGIDHRDPVTVPVPMPIARNRQPVRVALVTGESGPLRDQMHPAIIAAVRRAGAHLNAAGYLVEEVAPPLIEETLELFDIIVGRELTLKLGPLLGKFVDPLLAAGLNVLARKTAHIEVEAYIAALRQRDHVIRQWQLFMQTYPLIVMPPCSVPSIPVFPEKGLEDAVETTLGCLSYARLSPVLGFPALAVPVTITPELFSGRPLGVDIMAPRYREDLCLDAGEIIQAHEGSRKPVNPVTQPRQPDRQ